MADYTIGENVTSKGIILKENDFKNVTSKGKASNTTVSSGGSFYVSRDVARYVYTNVWDGLMCDNKSFGLASVGLGKIDTVRIVRRGNDEFLPST